MIFVSASPSVLKLLDQWPLKRMIIVVMTAALFVQFSFVAASVTDLDYIYSTAAAKSREASLKSSVSRDYAARA